MAYLTPRDRIRIAQAQYATLYRIARRRTRCPDDARDALQEALTQVGEAELHDSKRVLPWVRAALVHICADRYREPSAHRRARAHTAASVLATDPADDVCHRAELTWFRRVIETLPTKHREVAEIMLHGGGVREVAEHFGITYKAAEHRVAATKVRLRIAVMIARAASVVGIIRSIRPRPRPTRAVALTPLLLLPALVLIPVAREPSSRLPASRATAPTTSESTALRPDATARTVAVQSRRGAE